MGMGTFTLDVVPLELGHSMLYIYKDVKSLRFRHSLSTIMVNTPKLPEPSDYVSSVQVRNAISLAYSTFHNPRNLEKMWSSAWNETFRGLIEPYKGLFTIHAEYPMFLPSLILRDRQLRQQFADNDLDYHESTLTTLENRANAPSLPDDILGGLSINDDPDTSSVVDPSGEGETTPRRSSRIIDAQIKARANGRIKYEDMIEDLLRERDELAWDTEEARDTEKRNSKPGYTLYLTATDLNPFF